MLVLFLARGRIVVPDPLSRQGRLQGLLPPMKYNWIYISPSKRSFRATAWFTIFPLSCFSYHDLPCERELLLWVGLSLREATMSKAPPLSHEGHVVWATNKLCYVNPLRFGGCSLLQHNLTYPNRHGGLWSQWRCPKFRKWHLSWDLKDKQQKMGKRVFQAEHTEY